jgi:hypothetical protein
MGDSTSRQANDFVILGPTLASGNNVLEAIHALYFLPESFTLVFINDAAVDPKFYQTVMTLIAHDELGGRVRFVTDIPESNAVILPHRRKSRARRSVAGDTPEALASAILRVARATT